MSVLRDRSHPAWALTQTACENDDTILITEAIEAVFHKSEFKQGLHQYWIFDAIKNNSANVIKQLIEYGVDVKDLRPSVVAATVENKRTLKKPSNFWLSLIGTSTTVMMGGCC